LNPHPDPPLLGEGVYGKPRICQFAIYVSESCLNVIDIEYCLYKMDEKLKGGLT
jgi:hypothetical protein